MGFIYNGTCTAQFLTNWQDNHRLKKDSPVGHAQKMGLLSARVEANILKPCMTPLEELSNVLFYDQVSVPTNKKSQPPDFTQDVEDDSP
ncbi:hypothetical protein JTE90_000617 [Oedothorax gibbosus]|uniref:Uncharacterized protein n=1 Tax=Oedothorax gibbosus TaxID=931172 RepID=A0AAV6VXU4_9ARAC|nr:hypothetical protein JTE90_000617 [Oedothorax gibbosus]